MSDKKETKQVAIMSLLCAIVAITPYFVWWNQIAESFKNVLFGVIVVISNAALFFLARINHKDAVNYETETNGKRLLEILIAVFIFIWLAGWATYQNELVK